MLQFVLYALDSKESNIKKEALCTITNITTSLRKNDNSDADELGQAQALLMLLIGEENSENSIFNTLQSNFLD